MGEGERDFESIFGAYWEHLERISRAFLDHFSIISIINNYNSYTGENPQGLSIVL